MWGDVVGLEFNDTDVDSWLALFTFTGYHIMAGRQMNNCVLLLSETSDSFQLLIS